MTRDTTTRTAQRREAAYHEKLARNLAARAPRNAQIPQRGTRPAWVTPRVLISSAWYGRKGLHARRAGITRATRSVVYDPRTCLRLPGRREDVCLRYPKPKHS